MEITGSQNGERIKRKTGAGMMDCKKALQEANGDSEKKRSEIFLREKGLARLRNPVGLAAEGLCRCLHPWWKNWCIG